MDVYVLDTGFERVTPLDNIVSFIWTDRYNQCGDFELTLTVEKQLLHFIQRDYYIEFTESKRLMIVESIEIDTDIESGNTLIVKGRSLESILDRRIIWDQTIISGNFQNGIKTLLQDAIISPSIASRKIANFVFKASTDTTITSLTIDDTQYTGDGLYDVICNLCQQFNIGFKIILNENKQFEFSLYNGVYRTYDQVTTAPVIFSPEYENVINSSYFETSEGLKTVTLVAGEGEGAERKTVTVGTGADIYRRELYTDARDISSTVEGDTELTPAEYNTLLTQRGIEKLNETNNELIKVVDGELETARNFKINEDYFLGDVVQFRDDFHSEAQVRITEVIMSMDTEGYQIYPTFDYKVEYDYLLAESAAIIQAENLNEIEVDL